MDKKTLLIALLAISICSTSILAADITTGLKVDLRNNQTKNASDVIDWGSLQLNYTLTNGATFNSSLEYTYLPTTSSYLRSPSSTIFNIGSGLNRNGTIVIWRYVPADTGTSYDMFTIGAGSSAFYCYEQLASSNNIRCDIQNSSGTGEFYSTNLATPIGTWYMFALTINSAGLTSSYIGNESGQLQTGNTWTPTGGIYANASGFPMLYGGSGATNPLGGGLGCFRLYNITKTTQDLQALIELGHSCDNSTITITSNIASTTGSSKLAEAGNIHTGFMLANQTIQYNNYSGRLDCNGDQSEDCNITQAAYAIFRLAYENMTVSGGWIRAEMSLESVYNTTGLPKACSQSDYASYCFQLGLNYYAYTKGYHVKWQSTYMPNDLANNTNGLCQASGNRTCAPINYANFGKRVENHSRLIGCDTFKYSSTDSVCGFQVWNEPDLSQFYLNNSASRTNTAFRGNLSALHKAVYDGLKASTSTAIVAAPIWIAPIADVFDSTAVSVRTNLMSDLQTAGYTNFLMSNHLYLGAWSNTGKYADVINSAYAKLALECTTYGFDCSSISIDEWNTYYPGQQNASAGSYNYTKNQAQIANALFAMASYQSSISYSSFYQTAQFNNYSVNNSEYPRFMSAIQNPIIKSAIYLSPYDPLWRYTQYAGLGDSIKSCTNGESVYIDCLVTQDTYTGKYYLSLNNIGELDRTVRVNVSGYTVTNARNVRNNTINTATNNVLTLLAAGPSTNTYELNISDSVAPTVTVTSPTAATYTTSSITINFNATDAISAISALWYYNGSTNVSYTSSNTITLINGTYTYRFYANDTSGNIGNTNVTFIVYTSNPYSQPDPFLICSTNATLLGLGIIIPLAGLAIYGIRKNKKELLGIAIMGGFIAAIALLILNNAAGALC